MLIPGPEVALRVTAALTAVAVVLQSVELMLARPWWSAAGVWRISTLAREFNTYPQPLRLMCKTLLPGSGFAVLLTLRLLCGSALMIWTHPALVGALFIATLLVSVRWRGTFNGGSDCMTLVVLTGLGLSTWTEDTRWVEGGLWYICIQMCMSYARAGIAKLRDPVWRRGDALGVFVQGAAYAPTPALMALLRPRWTRVVLSWGLILFECAVPLALLHAEFALVIAALGVVFHALNVYVLGLNRFLFIWVATYPALLWCAQ